LVKIVEYNGQRRITLPKELADEKGWKPGVILRFIEMPDGSVMLKEVKGGHAKK
jgi:AbrB family looped-hinge helix DNA binding protein